MGTVDRAKVVLSAIFNVEVGTLNDASSPDDIDAWDSVGHMNMVVALEEEFELEFTEEESMEMMNFELVCELLKEKGLPV